MPSRSLERLADALASQRELGPSALMSAISDLLLEGVTGRPMQIAPRDRTLAAPLVPDVLRALADEDPFDDSLGSLYMLIASRRKQSGLGQFFTPSEISALMASLGGNKARAKGITTIHDPACGAGSMLLAAMRLQYQDGAIERCSFSGIDIDPLCTKMCAAQLLLACARLSLRPAHLAVVTGDTLRMAMSDVVLLTTDPRLSLDEAVGLPFMTPELAAVWHKRAAGLRRAA